MSEKIRKCYILRENGEKIKKKCIIQEFPDMDKSYGIVFIEDDAHNENIIIKGYKVPSILFLLWKKAEWMTVFILSSLVFTFFFPVAIISALVLFSIYFYFYKPYAAKDKIKKAQEYFSIFNLFSFLGFLILYINSGITLVGKDFWEDVLIGGVFVHILFIFLKNVKKYNMVFASGISSLSDWKKAKEFIWME